MGWIAEQKDILLAISSIVAVCGFLWGLKTYASSVRLQRAKWMMDFYRIFFVDESYKDIRRRIDFEFNETLAPVLTKVFYNSDQKFEKEEQILLQRLDDYLNFFEFILELKGSRLKQIDEGDFKALFSYFISRLGDFDLLKQYLGKYDYEFISQYLKK